MAFAFSVNDTEKQYLMDVVKASIETGLASQDYTPPEPPTAQLKEHLGAFVTLKLNRNLRGCIGHVIGDSPLYTTVAKMARAAAFEDPRFPPLTAEEYQQVHLEISILSPVTVCSDTSQVEVGRHGLIVNGQGKSGLLLPQVPVEWKWNREEFLDNTCRKAGLPMGCWKEPTVKVFWFEAVVF